MKSQPLKPPKRLAHWVATGLLVLSGALTSARGQEAVRMSIASAQSAEARRRAATRIGYYNLKLGPTAWNFGAGLGVDYNSNVNYTETDPEGDFIIRPQINTRMLWPVSDQNSINLALGGGYSAYVEHSELDRLYINPGTELSFDLYAGDFWLNLHDRFSLTENSYQNPAVTGTGDYSQLQNALGLAAVWDLNKGVVRVGYDHVNYASLSGSSEQNVGGQPSGYSEVFAASAGYALKPGMLAGLELGWSPITYTTTTSNTLYSSADQWNMGAYYDTPVSEYIHFTGHAGYTVYSPESSGATTTVSDSSGIYAQLDLRHRVNQYVEYTLSGGQTIGTDFWGGALDQYFANWRANWRILRKVTLSTSFSYFHGTYLYSGGETYDQYGPGISLSRPITANLSGSLGYQFYLRDSNSPGQNYTVSILSLNFRYAF